MYENLKDNEQFISELEELLYDLEDKEYLDICNELDVEFNFGYHIFRMEDFDSELSDYTPSEILERCEDIDLQDDFFYEDASGNWHSTDDLTYTNSEIDVATEMAKHIDYFVKDFPSNCHYEIDGLKELCEKYATKQIELNQNELTLIYDALAKVDAEVSANFEMDAEDEERIKDLMVKLVYMIN